MPMFAATWPAGVGLQGRRWIAGSAVLFCTGAVVGTTAGISRHGSLQGASGTCAGGACSVEPVENQENQSRREGTTVVPQNCSGSSSWFTGERLGTSVYAVSSHKPDRKYVVKFATKHEIDVMSEMKTCDSVTHPVEASPCVDFKREKNAYIMPRMGGSLRQWMRRLHQMDYGTTEKLFSKFRSDCFETVSKQLYDMRKCLHGLDFVHGQLHADNLLYQKNSKGICPQGLTLGDFDSTMRQQELMPKIDQDSKPRAFGYLPQGVLKGLDTNLPASVVPEGQVMSDKFTATGDIDFCSLGWLIYTLFERRLTRQVADKWKITDPTLDCGLMGPLRKFHLVLWD